MLTTDQQAEIVTRLNSRAWEGANTGKCPHELFPEVAENDVTRSVVVSLAENMGDIYADVKDDENALPILASSLEHSLIIALAVGLTLGRAMASDEIAAFVVPDFPDFPEGA